MVATYDVVALNGSGPTETVVTAVRLRSDDQNTADLNFPCLIDSVLRRSYWKNLALKFAGTFSEISNIRIHSDGAIGWTLGTLGKLKLGNRDTGDIGVPTANYAQASGTPGVTGNDLEVSHAYFSGQTTKSVDIASVTSGSPKTVDSTKYTVAGRSNHIVIQAEIDTDATQGVQTAETLTFLVDEI